MGTVAPQQLTVAQRGSALVAGDESVGRQLRLRSLISRQFVAGRLTEFCPESGQHKFTSNDGREEWVSLGSRTYQWISPVASHARPNPTFKEFPGNHEAIGWKIRVYWNEMGKWYIGRIRAYDQMTRLHHVVFFDGDERWYTIRNEAVEWIEKMNNRKKSQNGAGEWVQNVSATAPEGSETDERRVHNNHDMKPPTRNGRPSRNSRTTSSGPTATTTTTSIGGTNGNGRISQEHHSTVNRSVLPSGMTLRPLRNQSHDHTTTEKNPAFSILQTRVGIYWPNDHKYYRGSIVSYNEATEKFGVRYDDNQEEDVELEKEDFKWLGPKSFSAGYTARMKEVMILYGFKNACNEKIRPPVETPSAALSLLTQPKEIVGRKLFLYWEATGARFEAEVLAHDARRKQHYLWFRDGELEWVDLRKERIIWGEESRLVKEFPAGLEEGGSIPRKKAAVGWRIAVYWPVDLEFYEGRVTKYHSDTGRHDVDYDDGTHETLSLSSEKIIWKAPPATMVAATVDSKEGSETTVTGTTQKAPSSNKTSRGTVQGPSLKRPRLPSPPSSDLAKENKAIQIDRSLTTEQVTGDAESLPFGRFFSGSPSSTREADGQSETPDEEEDLDLYPVVKIPPEPLPPLQHTRLAKLPPQYGASVFQVKIIAAAPSTETNGKEFDMDDVAACVHDYHAASTKIGRIPSAIEATMASQILPKGAICAEYPTKELTGMETVALRTGPPLNRKSSMTRFRGRKKTRNQRDDSDVLSASLDSVFEPFPSHSTADAMPTTDSRLRSFDVDYSRSFFDAATGGNISSFMDVSRTPPPEAEGHLLRHTISSNATANPPSLEQPDGEAAI